ncbi:hypothetical protein AF72_02895 [Xylella taiwanensis]|uniref:Uncharacterized protein n=1 Tax=Xylella taiwanensis TaxID=1444770 RepID=Z9JLQ5_9GAMM|nr:hypothetical protein AB672_09920 [Xylella taiwanensis]EWS78913.1 hypothetical protein AF72_02895 [Xylella taiwanensis]
MDHHQKVLADIGELLTMTTPGLKSLRNASPDITSPASLEQLQPPTRATSDVQSTDSIALQSISKKPCKVIFNGSPNLR